MDAISMETWYGHLLGQDNEGVEENIDCRQISSKPGGGRGRQADPVERVWCC